MKGRDWQSALFGAGKHGGRCQQRLEKLVPACRKSGSHVLLSGDEAEKSRSKPRSLEDQMESNHVANKPVVTVL